MKAVTRILVLLLLLLPAGAGWADDEVEPSRAADLLPPVLMTAAWRPIIAEGRHAALTVGDFDEDGRMDLLVGQMSEGRLYIYRNVRTAAWPKFGSPTDFMAGGERACVPSGCYTGFNPQLVDADGDGRTDILSASFNSGIYLFRRGEDGTFAEPELLESRGGQPITFRYNGAALPFDWDADGDVDLLVRGGLSGAQRGVNLMFNEGSRRQPVFGDPIGLTAGGEPLVGKPCCVVDWDGDGKDDLLTCSGKVYWYRNTGEKGKPVLQPAEILVPSGSYAKIERRPDEPWRVPDTPGRIDSVCAADLNRDGRMDLLAISTWSETVELPEPTEEQKATDKELQERARAVRNEYNELRKPPDDEGGEERAQRQRKCLRIWKRSAALYAQWRRAQPRRDYGCVWLYERTAAAE